MKLSNELNLGPDNRAEERLLALERDIAGVEAGTEYVLDGKDVPLSQLPGKKNKRNEEQRHLRGALAKCGYQNWTFNKALKPSDQSKKTHKCKPLTNKNKANITIPYVQGVSEKLRRIFQNFNIATNFKPHSTLRQRLVHPKDRPHKGTKANVIYRLKCEEPNCNNTYIGETSRKVRYKEHCRRSANGYSSAIFHHLQHNQGHSFKLESTDVLDRETRWWERGVKEAIYERMYNPTLNREGGLRVDLSGT
ncbi:hypothetical protein Bbelb_391560 [Branchiostoma belcheri]|nr:hypothetical protein Bbelb_391560 [Branchiostoma belcheri]